MYILKASEYFKKKASKITGNNTILKKKLAKMLHLLKENPSYSSLKTHKIIDVHKNKAFSSLVSEDIRVIWNFKNKNIVIIELQNIGGHSGGGKVY